MPTENENANPPATKRKAKTMTTENQNANLPATTNDADLAALQGAARNLMTDETALKFVKASGKPTPTRTPRKSSATPKASR
jgi:hypothetical protein